MHPNFIFKKLTGLTIGTRLIMIVLLLISLMASATGIGVLGLKNMGSQVRQNIEDLLEVYEVAQRMRDDRHKQGTNLSHCLATNHAKPSACIGELRIYNAQILTDIEAGHRSIDKILARDLSKESLVRIAMLKDRLELLRKQQVSYEDGVSHALSSIVPSLINDKPLLALLVGFDKNLDQFAIDLRSIRQALGSNIAADLAIHKKLIMAMVILLLFGLALGIVLALYTAESIIKPLRYAVGLAERVAKGDRNVTVSIQSSGETGALLSSLNEMIAALKKNDDLSRRSLAFSQRIFDMMPIPVLVLDRASKVVAGNQAFYENFGTKNTELEGVDFFQVMKRSWDLPKIRSVLEDLKSEPENTVSFDITIEMPGVGTKYLLGGARRIPALKAGDDSIVFTFLDITRQKQIEQELTDAHKKTFQASQAKSEFLANVSHEIRTPMNAILGMAELLAETKLETDQLRYVQIFRRAGQSLLDIIDDILDLSKIEEGQMSIDPTDFNLIADAVEQVCEMMQLRAEEKGLRLIWTVDESVPDYVHGDAKRLRQVLTNLIGNAIKFTEKGEVRLHVSRLEADKIVFSVTDTGIGIPHDKLKVIFESFTQADSTISKKYGGTGLGLSISKKLVQLMGGHIRAESLLGRGSSFIFDAVLKAAQKPVQQDDAGSHSPRILLVEDSSDNRELILSYLAKQKYQIDWVENGLQAVERFRSEKYDAVLMDMQMPVMDGFTSTRLMREFEKETQRGQTPIIALSAYALKGEIQKSLDCGCTRHLTKPIKKAGLLDVLRDIVA